MGNLDLLIVIYSTDTHLKFIIKGNTYSTEKQAIEIAMEKFYREINKHNNNVGNDDMYEYLNDDIIKIELFTLNDAL